MTTNPTQENIQEPKELCQIYNQCDFIDAKDNQGDWRVGYILQKNPVNKLFKVRFDGWSYKYDQTYRFNSAKLAEFRSIITGYTGQKKHPGIRSDWKFNIKDHQKRLEQLKEFRQSPTSQSAWKINQFIRGHNYFYTDFLMTKTYQSPQMVIAIMDFFKQNISFCVQYLKGVDPEFTQFYRSQQIPEESHITNSESALVNAFYEIMDTSFIIAGGYSRLNSFYDNAALIKKYLNIDFEKNVKKYYQLFIYQQFLSVGGLQVFQELIFKKLDSSKCIIPFLFIKSIASLYNVLSNQMSHQDRSPWLEKLVEISMRNINKLNEKHIKSLNKTHVTEMLESLKNLFDDDSDRRQQIEKWALETEVKLCKLMVLCPIFQKKLKGVVNLIQVAEKNKSCPDSQYFVDLLLKHNILQCLFSLDNAEIIKKSAQLCKTLFYMDTFPKNSIYKIWQMRIGKHQSALQQIYSLIPVIPSRPNDEKFNIQLFEEISKIPKDQWDEQYIKMIKQYSLAAVGWVGPNQQINNTYGLDILYEYLMLKKNDFSLLAFIQTLDRFQKTSVIDEFVRKCFHKIQSNQESHTHTLIILKLIDQRICNLKQMQYDFTQPIIKDIRAHVDDPTQIIDKKFQLLSQITKITSTAITYEQFITLWKQFKGKKSQISFYNWVQKKKDAGKTQLNTRIGTDIRQKIFVNIWDQNYDYSLMEEKEAQIFIEFFKSINSIKGVLKRINIIIKVQTLELHYFDKIWQALQKSSKQAINELFANLIAEIHMNPYKIIQQQKEEWVKSLVTRVSNELTTAYKQNAIQKINKYLLVLKKLIERDEQIFQTKNNKYSMMKEYTVVCKANKEQKNIRFNVGGFCYDFKKLVSQKFKLPFKRFKISCKGEYIKYQNYFKSMIQCSFSIGSPFQIQIISGQIPSIKQCLNSELNLFFQLLGDQRLQRSVWQIISRLPIDKQFILKIQNSQQPWEQISNPSIYKQLYMLRVIGLMKNQWWQLFVNGNGLQTLVSKFQRITTNTKIQRQYLKMLLESIDKCLSISQKYNNIDFIKVIIDLFTSLHGLYENIEKEKGDYKRNSVQALITLYTFKICEKLMAEYNIVSVLLHHFPNLEQLLVYGLIKNQSLFLRRQFGTKLTIFNSSILKQDAQRYLNIILGSIFNQICQNCQPQKTLQYFQYAANLVKSSNPNSVLHYLNEKNPELLRRVENGLINEKPEQNNENINFLLIGYLYLMKQLVRFAPQNFKERICDFVIYKCFFTHLQQPSVSHKCKSRESRKFGFALLGSIIQDGKNVQKPLSLLSNLHKNALWRTRKQQDWTLTVADKLKSASGYVGLKNLGCTCYMNSFFQQIYMIPQFRQAIIQCEDPLQGKQIQKQNVLFQVKKMFYNLNESQKKYYVPDQFCHAFKNYEGQPTNVHEQMDIDEFSGMLFDRLQNQMKGTSHENVIKDFFGGVFSNQIICKGCPHFSETEQSFLSVSLSVKNKKNIYQSLDTMIKGDTLDGDNAYFCERCNNKVSAVKRVCLKKLPDHLILTLKRFQFDFQTMAKMKINDYCEFPIQLNVKQYSQQYLRRNQNPDRFDEEQMLPDSYYDYVLKGVAIHLGYADSGHYYSYVNQRKPNGKWYEFNDTVVRYFDVRRLPEQAFGGQTGTFEIKQKIKNAYMLIYERKQKVNDLSQYCKKSKQQLMTTTIYKGLSEQIQRDNVIQKIQNILFSEQYTNFVSQLLYKVPKMDPQQAVYTLKYIILVYLTVTIRQKQIDTSFTFLKLIHPILIKYQQVCEWLLTALSSQNSLIEFIKNNPAKQIKKLLASWMIDLVRICKPKTQYLLINSLLASMTTNHQNSLQTCYILSELIKNEQIMYYCLKKNMIGRLLQNLIRKQTPQFKTLDDLEFQQSSEAQLGSEVKIQKTPYQLSKKLKPVIDNPYLWVILNQVVQTAQKNGKDINQLVSSIEVEYMFLSFAKISKTLQECKGKMQIKNFTDYLIYFAKNNEQFTNQLINFIYKGILEYESKRYRQFFVLFKKLIKIQDNLKQLRNRKGLIYLIKALKQNQRYAFDCNIIQQWLIKIIRKNAYLQKILAAQKQLLDYLYQLAAKKKTPTEDICRKNSVFLESSVNKYHGIKMLRSVKKYQDLSKQMEDFYIEIANNIKPQQDQWQSDQDLCEVEVKKGDTIGFFDQKDAIDFIEAKVQDNFLNRLWIKDSNSKVYQIWKDDERLTSSNFKIEKYQSSEQIFYSDNATDLDEEDDNGDYI